MVVRLYRRTRDITEVNGLSKWMLIPNMKIKDFKQGLKRAKIRLENDAVDNVVTREFYVRINSNYYLVTVNFTCSAPLNAQNISLATGESV